MKEKKGKDDYYISPEVEEQDARIRKMTLADTVELMESEDTLGFVPACARYLYLMQVKGMGIQVRAMRRRAKIEGIEL